MTAPAGLERRLFIVSVCSSAASFLECQKGCFIARRSSLLLYLFGMKENEGGKIVLCANTCVSLLVSLLGRPLCFCASNDVLPLNCLIIDRTVLFGTSILRICLTSWRISDEFLFLACKSNTICRTCSFCIFFTKAASHVFRGI